jgi:hypothetical protein
MLVPAGCAAAVRERHLHGEPDQTHWLLFVIGGDAPEAEFSPEAYTRLIAEGFMTADGKY